MNPIADGLCLWYNPHMAATRNRKIGVFVELTRAFGRDLCMGITEFARMTGSFEPVFLSPAALRRPSSLATFDGFIARVMNDRMARAFMSVGRPVVDVFWAKPHSGFAIVKTNHLLVGRMAAEHFLSRRFANFGFCGSANDRSSDYCSRAFAHTLKKHGRSCLVYTPRVETRYAFDSSVLINERLASAPDAREMSRWLKRIPKPIAVFCHNDLRAWQCLQVCRSCGLSVPKDVAILGLDNDVIVCGFACPMISSVDPDTPAIGHEAARTLAEIIDAGVDARRNVVRHVPPKGVITRASTAIYPVDPPWVSDALVFIRRHVADHITAADVFAHTGYSHTLVDKAFRDILGTTVQKEINAARIETARHLLKTTSLSVRAVASLSGFASAEYFTRSFMRAEGIAPTAWRTSGNRTLG